MNEYLLGSILNMASLLMIGGCGALLCIRGGHFNLGGEGQVYAGGFVGALLLVKFGGLFSSGLPPFLAVVICFFASGLISAFLAFISAALKQYKNVDVLLSSFLVSSAVIPIIDSLIAGPLRGKTSNLLATDFIPSQYRFQSILEPSPLNLSAVAALLICVLLYLVFKKTAFGKELGIYGVSPRFALYAGFSEKKINFASICASGFLHGVVGMFSVCGTYFTCHQGFYAGLGWNSLSVALLSFGEPLLLIVSSFVLSAINFFASQTALLYNFGFDMGSLLQGVILFLIVLFASPNIGVKFFERFKKGW